MVRLNAVAAVVAVSLWLAGGTTCGLFCRRTVLADPVRLEKGFSFSKSFTVDEARKYSLALWLRKKTNIDARHPSPNDDFTAEFEIRSEGQVVIQGTNSPAQQPQTAILQRDYTAYLLCRFAGKPGQKYELQLRITRATADLGATEPVVTIFADPFQDKTQIYGDP